jgi:ATP-binding cassette subfamily B (MDR/TAP) protein 1
MSVFIPISFVCSAFVGKFSTGTNAKGNSASEEGGRITVETVDNIKTVVSLGREEHFIAEFRAAFFKTFRKELVFLHFEALVYSISNALLFFIQATAFAFGWFLMKNDSLSVENLFKIYACITFSSMILGLVYAQLPDQRKSREAARTVFRIIDRKSKIDNLSETGLKPDRVVGDIRFENITFSYPNRPNIRILDGFNLSIKNGHTNALVGPSGCGKSTTIGLMLRFYEPEQGTVYLDGVDIKTLNINWLRSKIGLVSQEPILYNTSIFENICNGDVNRDSVINFIQN